MACGIGSRTRSWKTYKSVRVGLSVYRHPDPVTRIVTVMSPAPAPIMITRDDSVSAAETRRLREQEVALRVLRDSLNRAPAALPVPPAQPRAKSEQNIPVRKDVPVVES
jgi:hypothetical protein